MKSKKGEIDFGPITKWIFVILFLLLVIAIIVVGIVKPGLENSVGELANAGGGLFS